MRYIYFVSALLCCVITIKVSNVFAADYTNSIGMAFVNIPKGCFMMGRDPNFEDGEEDELPQRRVCIENDFYLGKYEVTQAEWVTVMGDGSNRSENKGRTKPVENVSWHDAQAFMERLNAKEGGSHYRLPTEAEWEYAARAGTKTIYYFGDDAEELIHYAQSRDIANGYTRPVGQNQYSNPWGLNDILGNVFEWVEDCYHKNYQGAPSDGRAWTSECDQYEGKESSSDSEIIHRIVRGGSAASSAYQARPAYRGVAEETVRATYVGFRVVRVP